jgi:LPS export ABC transporter protein LptC
VNRKFSIPHLSLLLLLLIIVVLFLLSGRGKHPSRVFSPDEFASSTSLKITDFSYSRTEGPRKFLEIQATVAEYQDDTRTATLEKARARVYPRTGEVIQIYGQVGSYNLEQEVLTLPSGITAVTTDGLLIQAGRGTYHHQPQEIEFQSEVKIEGPNLYARGQSVKLETKTGKILVENGIEARMASSRAREILQIDLPEN